MSQVIPYKVYHLYMLLILSIVGARKTCTMVVSQDSALSFSFPTLAKTLERLLAKPDVVL